MQFIKPDVNIDIIGKKKVAFCMSGLLILISIVSLLIHGGPDYGIDFVGGTVIQVKFAESVKISDIKTGIEQVGLAKPSVQSFGEVNGHEYLIRIDNQDRGCPETGDR